MAEQIKSDKLFKLFLTLVWEYRDAGYDWDTAETLAWNEANDYYNRFNSEHNNVG